MYTATVDDSGRLSVEVTLRKHMTGFLLSASPDPEFDCVASPCRVTVNMSAGRGCWFGFQFGDDDVVNIGNELSSSPY